MGQAPVGVELWYPVAGRGAPAPKIRNPMRRAHWILGALVLLAPACGSDAPQAPSQQAPSQQPAALGRKTGEGEQCLVCGELIRGAEVVELRYKGRRFHVAAALFEKLMEDPDRYFSKLQARSALFDEEAYSNQSPMSLGWLYFGLYVLVGLLSAAVCGCLAVSRGLASMRWFFAGLVGNVIAVLWIVLARRGDPAAAVAGVPKGLAKVPTTHGPQTCLSCGHLNHPSAEACAHCGQPTEPTAESDVMRLQSGERS